MTKNSVSRPSVVDVPGVTPMKRVGLPVDRTIGRALAYIALTLLAIGTLLPLVWTFASSFTPLSEIFKNAVPFSWRALIPADFTLKAYGDLIDSPFTRALVNTIFVCAVTVLAGLFANSLAGFAFALFDFPGKRILFILVLITFMVPFEVLALPLYVIVNNLRFDNSYWALILPALANGLVIFLFRQFFVAIPRELLEAARVDGLSWFGIYTRIVVPLSAPVLVSGGLILFLSQWQAFFWPLLAANAEQYWMVQVALSNFQGQYVTRWDELFAGSVITIVIPMVLMLALQRYYIRTIAGTGLK